jgi:hypothetical protein
MKLMQTERTKSMASSKAGMDEKTARKYIRAGRLPSEIKKEHTWLTRKDPFEKDWEGVEDKLELNPGLEAKTLFEDLQRKQPGKYSDGQLRTMQRKVKKWQMIKGTSKEVYFSQVQNPGERCQSDFTYMNKLNITIDGECFNHLLYHFVLPYSNWESGTICFSESFESISEGFQNALWELGGVPKKHQTDSLSAAVRKAGNKEEFTDRYSALLNHYKIEGQKTNPVSPNENGSIEQRNYRFKRALDQSLYLRGSRNFTSRKEYSEYLGKLFEQLNMGRQKRFKEEISKLSCLPKEKLDSVKRTNVKVSKGSTVRVNHNVYSVKSRLIGQEVGIRLYVERLEVWYGQKCIDKLPRIKGSGKCRIDYRHIIDWLVRKPGAFSNYVYREEMFPSHRFRLAFDILEEKNPARSNKEYLGILYLAARENEAKVERILGCLLDEGEEITAGKVKELLTEDNELMLPGEAKIEAVDLKLYDKLLIEAGVVYA